MAELSMEELEELKNKFSELVSTYESWKDSIRDTSALDFAKGALGRLDRGISDFKLNVTGATDNVRNFMSNLQNWDFNRAKTALGSIVGTMQNFSEVNLGLQTNLTNLVGIISSVVMASTGTITLPQDLVQMASGAQEASTQLGGIAENMIRISGAIPGIDRLTRMLGTPIQNILRTADAARNMQMSLLMSSSAAGDLGNLMDGMGGSLENLSQKTLQYTDFLQGVANANSITIETAAKYSNVLRQIPGAIDMTIDSVEAAGGTMNMLDAVIKVASGTFQSFETVMNDINMLFENFNIIGDDSLTFISRMHSASQSLQIPMGIMRDFVRSSADSFKFLGDNTQASINVMSRFATALRGSDVGPAALRDIVGNITRVVSELDIAQRAFVSQRTGGPSGLQGAFQLSLAMQQGRMEDVYRRVETTLRQMMGGRIVTLEQAATDARSAAQMARQVQMLTTGPLAIARNEAQAFRILEAFARGETPTREEMEAAAGPPPEEALNQAVERGNAVQERQMNKLTEIHNELQRQTIVAATTAEVVARGVLGQASPLAEGMRQERTAAQQRAGGTQPIRGMLSTRNLLDVEFQRTTGALGEIAEEAATRVGGLGREIAGIMRGEAQEITPGIPTGTATQDIEAGARIMAQEQKRAEAETVRRGESSIVIKVMSERDVERMIRVYINENNEIVRTEEMRGAFGTGD